MQGNCDPGTPQSLLEDMAVSTAGRVEYPPLKPFQCVLLMDKPFLWNNNATLWLDNLYLAVSRTQVGPQFSMIEYGTYGLPLGANGKALYITDSAFVAEGRGSARAVQANEASTSVLIEGARSYITHSRSL